MRRSTTARATADSGAAAVEFALLLPLFLALVLGIITAGMAFERWIGITQGAREGSRVGATLSLAASNASGTGDIDSWLAKVYDASVRASGIGPDNPGFAACVALSQDGTSFTSYSAVGTATPTKVVGSSCYTDGATGPRVQVVLERNSRWDWFFAKRDVPLKSRSTTLWEKTS